MKNLDMTFENGEMRINGYPEAERVVEIVGPKAKKLKELVLHQHDVNFSFLLLQLLNNTELSEDVRIGLWYCSITVFFKCFQHSESRKKLEQAIVYKERKDALPAFVYFKNLRNKFIVHDENAFSNSFVGAIINKPESSCKIGDIISGVALVGTLNEEHWQPFYNLVRYAAEWIEKEKVLFHDLLGKEYEKKSYEELYGLKQIDFTVPDTSAVYSKRP